MRQKPFIYFLLYCIFSIAFLFIFVKNYGVREYSDYCKNSQIKNIKNSTDFQILKTSLFLVEPNCIDFEFTANNLLSDPYTIIWSESRIIINNVSYYTFVNIPDLSYGLPNYIENNLVCNGDRRSPNTHCGVNEKIHHDFSQPLAIDPKMTKNIKISRFFPLAWRGPKGRGPTWASGGTFSLIDNAVTTLSVVYIYKGKKYKNNYSYMLALKSS